MKIFYWVPRILGTLFIIFVSVFALDVFNEGYGPLATLVAFMIHLVPAIFMVVALIIAWKNEAVGGGLFMVLGYIFFLVMNGQFNALGYFLLPAPLFLIGMLFIIEYLLKRKFARLRVK